MFIQNMTTEEMAREYHADLPEIEAKNKRIDGTEYVVKSLYKARKTGKLYFVRHYTTARNNKYINVFEYIKSNDSKGKNLKWDWNVRSVALMQTYKGTCAIAFFGNADIAIVFQQHFFVRYKQRLLSVCDWRTKNELNNAKTIEDIIAVWIKRNPDISWINTKVKFGDKEHVFAPIKDGVILIQWGENTIQANTFITNNMCSDKQFQMVSQAKEAKQEQEKNQAFIQTIMSLIEQKKSNNTNI